MTLKLALGLLSFAAFAQTPPNLNVTGLVVTSTVMDRTTHLINVSLQSHSDKTIVAYGFDLDYLDANGITVSHYGVGYDWFDPEGKDISKYILPGQPTTVVIGQETDPKIVSVKVTLLGIVYSDNTYEGPGAAGAAFDGRINAAAEIRKLLAQQSFPAAERTRLEKRAAGFEAAAIPKEGK